MNPTARKWILGIIGGLLLPVVFFGAFGLIALAFNEYILNSPLVRASSRGDVSEVRRLLENESDVNQATGIYGHTALCRASANGHVAVVMLLLDAGADVNAPGNNDSGLTPVIAAVKGGHTCAVRILLEHGASPNKRGYSGRTPLSVARAENRLEIMALLKEHGATE